MSAGGEEYAKAWLHRKNTEGQMPPSFCASSGRKQPNTPSALEHYQARLVRHQSQFESKLTTEKSRYSRRSKYSLQVPKTSSGFRVTVVSREADFLAENIVLNTGGS